MMMKKEEMKKKIKKKKMMHKPSDMQKAHAAMQDMEMKGEM